MDFSNNLFLTPEEQKNSFATILEQTDPRTGVCIFSYGSLMWNPEINYSDFAYGKVRGFSRDLCIRSIEYRGTPQSPGLVFGLKQGGSCHGKVYHLSPNNVESELWKVWQREMLTHVYKPTWVDVNLSAPTEAKTSCSSQKPSLFQNQNDFTTKPVRALTFTGNCDHPYFFSNLEPEEQIRIVRSAAGNRGSCFEYVRETYAYIKKIGITDNHLQQIVSALEKN